MRGEWMREILQIATGLSIPFAGTTLGAAMVFLMKNEMNKKLEKLLLGFAAGDARNPRRGLICLRLCASSRGIRNPFNQAWPSAVGGA